MLNEKLSSLATLRETPLFQHDVDKRRSEIEDALAGKKVLVIGGAGSIGAATIKEMARFPVRSMHVMDQSENNLAELVRDLRSSPEGLRVSEFRCIPLDYGSNLARRVIYEERGYDFVLNFAALKHVRSEKDVYSVLQLLDTNVLKQCRLLEWLADTGGVDSYFCVSTDKAANPVNLMGASKRLMEHVVFSNEIADGFARRVTSARFANVAFSDGSLLHSFLRRLEKRQPLAAPANTRRFFISQVEAGELCLLAAVCGVHQHLCIPQLHPSDDLRELLDIAIGVIKHSGLKPVCCESEEVARTSISMHLAKGEYPLLVTSLDTTGEKPYEEFVGKGESVVDLGFERLLGIAYRPIEEGCLAGTIHVLNDAVYNFNGRPTKEEIVGLVASTLPEFVHAASEKSLDERM